MCYLVFCSIPPLSVVGLSEEQALDQANGDVLVFTSTFNPMKNTISGYVLNLRSYVAKLVCSVPNKQLALWKTLEHHLQNDMKEVGVKTFPLET